MREAVRWRPLPSFYSYKAKNYTTIALCYPSLRHMKIPREKKRERDSTLSPRDFSHFTTVGRYTPKVLICLFYTTPLSVSLFGSLFLETFFHLPERLPTIFDHFAMGVKRTSTSTGSKPHLGQ